MKKSYRQLGSGHAERGAVSMFGGAVDEKPYIAPLHSLEFVVISVTTMKTQSSNLKLIHSHIVSNHLSRGPPNKVLQDQTPSVSPAELLLSRETRRTLAQLRTNKSPLLVSYLFSIGDPRHPSPLCPLCLMHDHTSSHLFECKSLPTSLSSLDLWTNPDKVEPFLATWGERLLAAT